MKRPLLLSFLSVPLFVFGQTIWSDDFESYADGAYCAENSGGTWTTWSNTPGSSEDALITIDQQHGGSKSVFIDGPTGNGPVDLVHLFNITSGHYELTLWINVAEGAGGYFNLLHKEPSDPEWAVDVFFLPDQSGYVLLDNVEYPFTYTFFNWVEFRADIDIDGDEATYYVNGTAVATQPWSTQSSGGAATVNDLSAIDIFAFSGGSEPATFYIDDISLSVVDVGVEETTSLDVRVMPNPVEDLLTVELDRPVTARTNVAVTDATGRPMDAPRTASGNRMQVDMTSIPAGLYTLLVSDGGEIRMEKVVKR